MMGDKKFGKGCSIVGLIVLTGDVYANWMQNVP